MLKRLTHFFNRFSIRYKLFLVVFALLVITCFLFSMINLSINREAAARQATFSAEQALAQARSFIENKCSSVIDILDITSANETVRRFIAVPSSTYRNNLTQWWSDASELNIALFNLRSNKDIAHLHLYFDGGLTKTADNSDFSSLDGVKNQPWFTAFSSGSSVYEWLKPGSVGGAGNGFVHAVRRMPSSENLQKSICYIRADIPVSIYKSIMDQGAFTKGTALLLKNSQGQTVCASAGTGGLDAGLSRFVAENLTDSDIGKGACRDLIYGGTRYLAGATPVKRSDWTLYIITPYDDIMALGVTTQQQIWFVFLIVAPLTLPFAFWAVQSATKRIRRLTAHMVKYGAKYESEPHVHAHGDEIEELSQSFREMLARIDTLLDEKYKLGREIKNLEMKALQAQINPHFLYNTLNLINTMGLKNDSPEIVDLVNHLSRFYKLSLSRGESMATLKNEIELVKSYTQIQNRRYEDCITLAIDVPDELMGLRMPKIILQPLVENAIMHGIMEKQDERGTVTIYGRKQDGCVVLAVEDDGVGIGADMLGSILQGVPSSEMHGYGIKNIDERLRLTYGEGCGLRFESEPGRGTRVIITIPAA